MKKILFVYLLIAVSVSCQKEIAVMNVTLSETSIKLVEGDSKSISATVYPADATNKEVTWTSSNTSIASVSNGIITAIQVGSATISVQTVDGGKSASCLVTVEPKYIAVNSITLDKASVSLYDDEEITLTATLSPSNSTTKTVLWKSSDETVATVSNGKVKAIKEGSTEVTASIDNVSAKCIVTVNKRIIHVESVSLSSEKNRLVVGDTLALVCAVLPNNANNYELVYSSSDESVAIVNNEGVVTAINKGEVTISVSAEGKEAFLSMSVISGYDIYYAFYEEDYYPHSDNFTSWVYKNDNIIYESKQMIIQNLQVVNNVPYLISQERISQDFTRAVVIENGVANYLHNLDNTSHYIVKTWRIDGALYHLVCIGDSYGIWMNYDKIGELFMLETLEDYSQVSVSDWTIIGRDVYACGAIWNSRTRISIPVIWKNGRIYKMYESEKPGDDFNCSLRSIIGIEGKLYLSVLSLSNKLYQFSIWDENGMCYNVGEPYKMEPGIKLYCFDSKLYVALKYSYPGVAYTSKTELYNNKAEKIVEIKEDDIFAQYFDFDYIDGDVYGLFVLRRNYGNNHYYSTHIYKGNDEVKMVQEPQYYPLYISNTGIQVRVKE